MTATVDEDRLHEYMGGIVGHMAGMMTMASVLLGEELGLYRKMAGQGPMTAAAIAAAGSVNERLTQEWLDQQVSAGLMAYDAKAETYELGPEGAMALADRDSPVFLAAGLGSFRSLFMDLDLVADAFRGDGGLAWGDHHPCLFHGVAEFFRPAYQHHLNQEWIPALDGVADKLVAGATVADVGCGEGVSTREMAKAFPNSEFVGFDFHKPSVEAANAAAEAEGLTNVRFESTGSKEFSGAFDLVCFFDCLHDMGDPVGIATHAKSQLAPGGSVMVVEPFAFDSRAENHAALGAVFYGASTFICTPSSLAQEVGRGMGAQSGEVGMRAVFDEAGYGSFSRATETPFNIVYQAMA